jgi:hypothetical protein
MPFTKRIAEVDRDIEATMAALVAVRAERDQRKLAKDDAEARIQRLLADLAKLKAEKMRLALRQRLITN